jgi:hypothetical protein
MRPHTPFVIEPEYVDLSSWINRTQDQGNEANPEQVLIPLPQEAVEAASAWIQWAQKEVEKLRGLLFDRDQKVAEQGARLTEQDEAIKGVEAWRRLRRNTVESLELGSKVIVGQGEQLSEGRICGVYIFSGGIHYDVVWWINGQRQQQFLPADEVQELTEPPLPHPLDQGARSAPLPKRSGS